MSNRTDKAVRVRFAPSPTGFLHVGGARTALFNWLFARHHGGAFVLRIEDTDRERSDDASYRAILDGLRWLGLDWDEGPGIGGGYGPYKQSERRDRYRAASDKLLAEGKAYACTCTPEELAERRKQAEAEGGAFLYDGRCRPRAGEPLPEGPHVLRFRIPDETTHVAWRDGVRKKVGVSARELDDFVLIKSDAFPTYNFAAVVDDAAMAMTDILRGDDHISNTPKQILLYHALGAEPPRFAHIPMILGPDGSRLSKRHGATSVSAYRDEGILPEAMVNFLALLGWSLDGKTEFFTREELIEKFTLGRVTKSAAVFNRDKLDWMNGQYFRKQPEEVRLAVALEELRRHGVDTSAKPESFWRSLVAALGDRFSRPSDAWEGSRFLFAESVEPDGDALEKLAKWPEAPSHMEALARRLLTLPELTAESAETALRELAGELEVKAGLLIHPARIALTGRAQSFGIFDVMVLLGKDETVRRLRLFVQRNREGKGSGRSPDK